MRRRKIRAYSNLSYIIGLAMGIKTFAFAIVYSWLGEYGCPADEMKEALIGFGVILLVELILLAMVRIRLLGLVEAEEAFREACHIKQNANVKNHYVRVPYRTHR